MMSAGFVVAAAVAAGLFDDSDSDSESESDTESDMEDDSPGSPQSTSSAPDASQDGGVSKSSLVRRELFPNQSESSSGYSGEDEYESGTDHGYLSSTQSNSDSESNTESDSESETKSDIEHGYPGSPRSPSSAPDDNQTEGQTSRKRKCLALPCGADSVSPPKRARCDALLEVFRNTGNRLGRQWRDLLEQQHAFELRLMEQQRTSRMKLLEEQHAHNLSLIQMIRDTFAQTFPSAGQQSRQDQGTWSDAVSPPHLLALQHPQAFPAAAPTPLPAASQERLQESPADAYTSPFTGQQHRQHQGLWSCTPPPAGPQQQHQATAASTSPLTGQQCWQQQQTWGYATLSAGLPHQQHCHQAFASPAPTSSLVDQQPWPHQQTWGHATQPPDLLNQNGYRHHQTPMVAVSTTPQVCVGTAPLSSLQTEWRQGEMMSRFTMITYLKYSLSL